MISYNNYHKVDNRNNRDCGFIEGHLRSVISNTYIGLLPLYRLFYRNSPYYTPAANRFLNKYLNNKMIAFEWGSGQSTLWISQRVKQLFSIEHDEAWYSKINITLSSKKYNNVKYYYKPPVKVENIDEHIYYGKKYLGGLLEKKKFINYANAISHYKDNYFDVIFIDGRERTGCFANAIDKLKTGGVIVIDDSFRLKYNKIFKLVNTWKIKHFNYGYLRTSILFKTHTTVYI